MLTNSRKLSALVNERDILAMVNSTLSQEVLKTTRELSTAEMESLDVTSTNKAKAKTMLKLAKETRTKEVDEIEDPDTRQQLRNLDEEVRFARRDWRIMKSVVSAVVANSGVNWAKDDKLRELVLDNEDEFG